MCVCWYLWLTFCDSLCLQKQTVQLVAISINSLHITNKTEGFSNVSRYAMHAVKNIFLLHTIHYEFWLNVFVKCEVLKYKNIKLAHVAMCAQVLLMLIV